MLSKYDRLLKLDNTALLLTIYLREILDKEKKENNFYSKEEIYDILLFRYLENETTPLNYQDLCNYYKDNYRFCLLKDLLNREKLKLLTDSNGTDHFITNHYSELLEILIKQIKLAANFNVEINDLQQELTDKEFKELIDKFLKEVDPTLEWLNIYQEALKNNKIIYIAKNDSKRKEAIYNKLKLSNYDFPKDFLETNHTIYLNQEPYLVVQRQNTIKDFYSFVHEFIHFVQFTKNKTFYLPKTVDEFMTIFYEKYALNFLLRNNYSQEEVNSLFTAREKNVFSIGSQIIQILYYLKVLDNEKDISFKEEVAKATSFLSYNLKKLTKNSSSLKDYPWQLNPISYTKKVCDDNLELLIRNGDISLLCKYYPYIIGDFLANKSLENLAKNNLTLEEMKQLTEKLLFTDVEDIFKKLNIPLNTQKTYQKY